MKSREVTTKWFWIQHDFKNAFATKWFWHECHFVESFLDVGSTFCRHYFAWCRPFCRVQACAQHSVVIKWFHRFSPCISTPIQMVWVGKSWLCGCPKLFTVKCDPVMSLENDHFLWKQNKLSSNTEFADYHPMLCQRAQALKWLSDAVSQNSIKPSENNCWTACGYMRIGRNITCKRELRNKIATTMCMCSFCMLYVGVYSLWFYMLHVVFYTDLYFRMPL